MELWKVPVPVPSLVLASEVVGCGFVLQQTPRTVTGTPPSEVTLPPQVAVVLVINDTLAVVTMGRVAEVINCTILP